MYKYMLCFRYLRTRYIALMSVVSVTLGVWAMIVTNSVMAGFTHEMQDRIHGILSDVIFESHSLEGFRDPEWHMERIRQVAGEDIVGMTPTVVVPAMLSFHRHNQWVTRQITFIGVDETTHTTASDFAKAMQHPANREKLSFELRENGYDAVTEDGAPRSEMEDAGWKYRRRWGKRVMEEQAARIPLGTPSSGPFDTQSRVPPPGDEAPATAPADSSTPESSAPAPSGTAEFALESPEPSTAPFDPFRSARRENSQEKVFDPSKQQHTGLVLGIALSSFRAGDGEERFLILPGDDVKVTFPTAGQPPKAVSDTFTVVDFYETKMSEYDSNFVFVPIRKLQELRGMIEGQTGVGYATSIQIKLREGADGNVVRDKLRAAFPPSLIGVNTWRDKQGALLSAVEMETSVLNILLFLIIAVAGFGILAIFFMIVVEKTRDIGILKSLGASSRGILGIFLCYGLLLGLVGSGAGAVIGLLTVKYINQVRSGLEWFSGKKVFDPSIYYFYKIPTIVDPFTVTWIVLGALTIAVLASIFPAIRAARLHPVQALRYE